LTVSQAFLAGVLLYMAVGFWADAGVGVGSVAAILVLLGLGVGGAWLYWLMGGVGWPMAAANAPATLFFAFTLVMGWSVESFDIGGAPLLLATAAAVLGVAAGVFLDSPRRWRWDQREKLRPGTQVPRVSGATMAMAAQVPRSLPRRQAEEEPGSELAARIEGSTPTVPEPSGEVGMPYVREQKPGADAPGPVVAGLAETTLDSKLTEAPDVKGSPLEAPDAPEPVLPTARLGRSAAGGPPEAPEVDDADEGIELPTMIEPKAQRSPWAWAAPPAWNRDEDDEPASGRSSDRS
jgi:hypothetical protein